MCDFWAEKRDFHRPLLKLHKFTPLKELCRGRNKWWTDGARSGLSKLPNTSSSLNFFYGQRNLIRETFQYWIMWHSNIELFLYPAFSKWFKIVLWLMFSFFIDITANMLVLFNFSHDFIDFFNDWSTRVRCISDIKIWNADWKRLNQLCSDTASCP